jgi:hypothetical protein
MTQITNCKLCNVRANDSTSALPHQRRLHIYANGSLTKYCSNINIQHLTQCKWRIDITAKKWRIDETGHPPQTQTTQQLFYI